MINKKEIIRTIEMNKLAMQEQGVIKLGLFGSFAKGKQHAKSDIDFLVRFDNKDYGDQYFELLFYLQDLFKRKIDLIPEGNLRKELRYVKKEVEYARI